MEIKIDLSDIGTYQNIVAAIIATVAAVIYNIYKHKHDKQVFKSQLFVSFNERYSELRDRLDDLADWEADINIRAEIQPYEQRELSDIIDDALSDPWGGAYKSFKHIHKYLTLCSEQYYWYKKGYVDEEVWKSWKQAMQGWHRILESFRAIIKNEISSNSTYYNDDFLTIFEQNKKE